MLIKTLFPIEELAGTIGMGMSPAEATFYKRNGLQCARQYTIPYNPKTTSQQIMRNTLAALSQYYSSTLTDDQRQEWTDYAKAHPVMIKDQSTNIGGLAWFVKVNAMIQMQGGSIMEIPPSSAHPAPDPNIYTIESPVHFYVGQTIGDVVGFSAVLLGSPATLQGMQVHIEITAPLPGAQLPRANEFRYIRIPAGQYAGVLTSTGATTNVDFTNEVGQTAQYVYPYTYMAEGLRVGYRITVIRNAWQPPILSAIGVVVTEAAV